MLLHANCWLFFMINCSVWMSGNSDGCLTQLPRALGQVFKFLLFDNRKIRRYSVCSDDKTEEGFRSSHFSLKNDFNSYLVNRVIDDYFYVNELLQQWSKLDSFKAKLLTILSMMSSKGTSLNNREWKFSLNTGVIKLI